MLSVVVIIIFIIQQSYPTYQLETIQAVLSSTVDLHCSVVNQNLESINPAKIVWIRDDQADIVSLDSVITVRDSRLSILTMDDNDRQERTLRIINIEEQDHGLYRCIQGDITLNEILLDVLIPPRIISHTPEHMHMTVREGRDAEFSCIASGHPTPTIIWHVNGLSRPGIVATIEGKNESVLILRNISRYDSGRVDCSASNTLSTVNRQFLLYVKYKPMVTVPFHLSYFRLYDSATITCQVCSIPSSTVFDIFRPKKAVPIKKGVKEQFEGFINETCRQLTKTIYLNHPSLFGPYVCRARNALGVNHAEFIIKELNQSTKHMKSITERRPSSTLSTIINLSAPSIFTTTNDTQLKIITTELIAQKNQAYGLSISVLLLIILCLL
ncbi:unnamed protein product [Adineta steineri]|uniref:Ig-like domain-containing protein n=1 Tax=Adineta steineri TaxID=433720 RepID=A0A815DK72_9BILA|nr:unnamed protein product [Adineta steineri]CAF3614662.1 unnamed protein product [Adineta steineri]